MQIQYRIFTYSAALYLAFLSVSLAKADDHLKYSPKTLSTWSVIDVLSDQAGKSVSLYLSNGQVINGVLSPQQITGTTKSIYLTSLAEKSYYGAMIKMSEIIGIEFNNNTKSK